MHEFDQVFNDVPVLRQPPDCGVSSPIRVRGRATSRAPFGGHHGAASDLERARHKQEAFSAQDLAIPVAKVGDHGS